MRHATIFAISLSIAAPAAMAASPGCKGPTARPEVLMQVSRGTVGYDFSQGSAAITVLARRTGSHHAGDGQIARGLTVARLVWRVRELEVSRFRGDGGEICSAPVRAVVEVGYEPGMTVYVQASYGSGTCQREAILRHEHGHVDINETVLLAHAGSIRQAALSAMSDPSFPVATRDADAGPRIALDSVSRAVGTAVGDMEREIAAENGEHDSPTSLDETTAACPAW